MQVQLSEERQAQLNEYAARHGQDPAVALDEVLGAALEWEEQDFRESLEAIKRGYEDVKAGRTRPVEEFFAEFRAKHGFSKYARPKAEQDASNILIPALDKI